jgi:hypothetical protein
MVSTDEILREADAALSDAIEAVRGADRAEQWRAMQRFMATFERLGTAAGHGAAVWPEARAWALRTAPRFVLARDALGAWHDQMWHQLQDNGEQGAELALSWRSQSAIAELLFRGTPAAELLASHNEAQFDEELHDQAENVGMDAADWVPRSHTWWRWGERRLQLPIAPEIAFDQGGPMKRNTTMPPAARTAIVVALRRESDHADALPDPLPLDRVLRPVDRTKTTTEQLRVLAGRDAQGYFLDFYKVNTRDETSFHGRVRDDGRGEKLENFEGQHGRRAFADPAETERERQRIIAHNARAQEILKKKGFR